MQFDGRILDKDEMIQLTDRAMHGDTRAMHALIEGHLRMFYKMALRYQGIMHGDEVVAIMVENVLEKFDAKYDKSRGGFTRYAKFYALQGIDWYLKYRLRVVHTPCKREKKAITNIDNLYDDAQICNDYLEKTKHKGELTAIANEEKRLQVKRKIRAKLNHLTAMEKKVVRRRFGLGTGDKDHDGQTYKVIGDALGYSHERIRQILNEALLKISPYMGEFVDNDDI